MKKIIFGAGILGGLGVILGAFGAHALHDRLEAAGMLEVWKTAVSYELMHAVALLALAGWGAGRRRGSVGNDSNDRAGKGWLAWAGGCWMVGVGLFSGSLYMVALGGPRWVGAVTPVGGVALVAGWVLVAIAGWREGRSGE